MKKTNEVLKLWKSNRDYKLLTYTNIITGIASWSSFIVMLILSVEITKNAIHLGILWSISGLLPIIFNFVIGAWIDRLNLKKVITYSEFIKGILYFLFVFIPFIDYVYGIILFIIVRFFTSILNSMTIIARQTIIPEIIKKEDLVVANSFNYTITSSIRFFGATAGGILSVLVNYELFWALILSAYLISGFMLFKITNTKKKIIKPNKNLMAEVVEGFKASRDSDLVRMVLLSSLCGGLVIGSYNIVLEHLTTNIYNAKGYGISLLYLAEGIVSILVGYWIANKKILFKNINNYGYIYLFMGLCWASIGFTTNTLFGMLSLMLYAFIGTFIVPFERQVMQMQVEPEVRGRVFGLWNTFSNLSMQVGTLITGFLIYYVGIMWVPLIICSFRLLMVIYFFLKTKNKKLNTVFHNNESVL